MSDFYKILVVGQSGKGKTYGARTLNPATTVYVNIENKPLPFKNAFKHVINPTTVADVMAVITKCEDPASASITTVVFDSFSAFLELLLSESRAKYKNFDIWNNYNEKIGLFMNAMKDMKREVIVIAHYETLNIEGDQEKRVKVKGKEWEGLIEKEFTIVLYADRNKDDKGVVNAWLDLSLDASSSKCPPDIFGMGVNSIENDYQFLVEKVAVFAGR
jgi:hypothetical protein